MENVFLPDFGKISAAEKVFFFDTSIVEICVQTEGGDLFKFFKAIILNQNEDAYIRKRGLEEFMRCVGFQKILPRHVLTLLVDDWMDTPFLFLELQRIKGLYLVYAEEETPILSILNRYLSDAQGEIVAEAYLVLGLIRMQKGLMAESKTESIEMLEKCLYDFKYSQQNIENRIDAQIYFLSVSAILEMLHGRILELQNLLGQIANMLFKREASAFNEKQTPLFLGFYRVLRNLYLIYNENPETWLDFRDGMRKLYFYYSSIADESYSSRFADGRLGQTLKNNLTENVIEPFFISNFPAQLVRFEAYMKEQAPDSEEYEYLNHIHGLILDLSAQRETKTEAFVAQLQTLFKNRPYQQLVKAADSVTDFSDTKQLMEVIIGLSGFTKEKFQDYLLAACVRLQSNRMYWTASEDDRNTFLMQSLEAAGFVVKDQTKQSISSGGISAGEIDLLVMDNKGNPYTIIEALNLDYLDKPYLKLHLDKVWIYDANGFLHNYIVVYATAMKFGEFWEKYFAFIQANDYPYSFSSAEEIASYGYTDIRIARAIHLRNGIEVLLYHFVINLNLRSPN